MYTKSLNRPIKILIDYSSMSRLWYTALLNWARFTLPNKELLIDFVYSIGKYIEGESQMVIRKMLSLPGCEGRPFRLRESIAVFGLGFYGMAALCVLDRLEVDTVYTFLAIHEPLKSYVEKTRKSNYDLMHNYKTKANVELPLISIENSYRYLANLISPYRTNGEITLVPMGPKPHVLTSILVAMRFKEVSCLRVSGDEDIQETEASGEMICTRIIVSK